MARHQRYNRAARMSRKAANMAATYDSTFDAGSPEAAKYVVDQLDEYGYEMRFKAVGSIVYYTLPEDPEEASDVDAENMQGMVDDFNIFGEDGFIDVTGDEMNQVLYDAGVSVQLPKDTNDVLHNLYRTKPHRNIYTVGPYVFESQETARNASFQLGWYTVSRDGEVWLENTYSPEEVEKASRALAARPGFVKGP